jgi:hypothetical protein
MKFNQYRSSNIRTCEVNTSSTVYVPKSVASDVAMFELHMFIGECFELVAFRQSVETSFHRKSSRTEKCNHFLRKIPIMPMRDLPQRSVFPK